MTDRWLTWRSWPPRGGWGWLAFGLAVLLVALAAYAEMSYALSREVGADVSAYWNAAMRLRSGEPLYVEGAANASDLYRYAPWFAAAWIPLTFLPQEAVTTGWVAAMVAAGTAACLPLLWRGAAGLAAFALLFPLQLQGALFGNAQPLLVLALAWGARRSSGPLWVGLAASLKAVPLLLALTYAARGEWRRAGLALLVTAALVAPVLLFDLSAYPTSVGPRQVSLAALSWPLWLGVALAAILAAVRLGRGRFAWLAAGVAMIASLPRLLDYEFGFVLVGLFGPASSGPAVPPRAAERVPTSR